MIKIFVLYVACIFLFGGCGTKNIVADKTNSAQNSDLSLLFNMQITKKDNLKLYDTASKWLKTPYKIGGNSKKGVDCSGFANAIYKDVYKKILNRSTTDIFKKDIIKVERSKLSEGDLVFFRTDGKSKKSPNHVGIYLKNGKFVHASVSKGVIVNSLDETYYKKAWISGGKVK
ncbi:MAG: C40 family peptidase [Campylobacteraceae bacterium]|jgi:lipoprotein Spr|nr:C40 family peptidase [Campylobacteraceae bacterium]